MRIAVRTKSESDDHMLKRGKGKKNNKVQKNTEFVKDRGKDRRGQEDANPVRDAGEGRTD